MRKLTNTTFLIAVLAINFTLTRPSPVDILIILTALMTLLSGQVVTRNVLIVLTLFGLWLAGLYISSVPILEEPEVGYYLLKITFAVSIGVCSCLVTALWDRADLRRFCDVYVAAACIAATLGLAGVLLGIEDLTWDGRAKGFLDDPNMYSAFLLPGLIASMFALSQGRGRLVFGGAFLLLVFGLALAFSRAAIGAFAVWGGVYFVLLNRRNLPRAGLFACAALFAVAVAVVVAGVFVDGLDDKIMDRTTVAKDYDLGHGGRYSRYALAIPFILDNPLGMGLLTMDRIFDEPIHNILIGSFLNYGWIAGFGYLFILIFTPAISLANYRLTRDPVLLMLLFCWIAIISCAFLHEAERWRHLWLFTGMIWGLNAHRLLRRSVPAVGPRPDPAPAGPASAGPVSAGPMSVSPASAGAAAAGPVAA